MVTGPLRPILGVCIFHEKQINGFLGGFFFLYHFDRHINSHENVKFVKSNRTLPFSNFERR